MDNLQPDDIIITGVRQRKKQTEPISCPVCGVTVRPSEMEYHYSVEVDRLHKVYSGVGGANKSRKSTPPTPSPRHHAAGCSTAAAAGATTSTSAAVTDATVVPQEPIDPKECWNTYQRIKNNRQTRLKVKSRKRKSDEPVCPVCNEIIAEDINVHVELCLRRNENVSNGVCSDGDESIDVEVESFEEYEWAGQTRIRVSSLLEGGYSSAGVGTSILNSTGADEEEDLNVDGDDTQVFGPSQYSERDVIIPSACCNKEQTENLYLRKLVVGGQDCSNSSVDTMILRSDHVDDTDDEDTRNMVVDTANGEGPSRSDPSSSLVNLTQDSKIQVICALKARIREYELQKSQKCKCLICMDEFRVPVVSICCWHVHCEECWLRTLGARKLCPQCNMITSPTDLRRIYM